MSAATQASTGERIMYRVIAMAALSAVVLLGAKNALAQSAADQLKRTQQQNSGAARSSNTNAGAVGQSRQGFDTPAKSQPAVRAQTAPKPSPVGQPVTTSSKGIGYKPQQKLHTNPVPAPVVTRPAPTPTVSRSTTTTSTPTVSRSTTTTSSSSSSRPSSSGKK
jgi:hypothetical protein